MSSPIAAHLEAAKRLLAQDSASHGNAEERARAAGRVFATLFQALAPVIGLEGVRALFARSVKLAKVEFPCLEEVVRNPAPVERNGDAVSLAVVGCLSKLEATAASEVATGLFARFLALTTGFIGDGLVWQIVKRAFPVIGEVGESHPKEKK